MKKLFLLLVLVLSTSKAVEAQSVCFLPSACGTTTFTGGTLTGPILLPDGTVGAPSLSFSSVPSAGLYRTGNGFALSHLGVLSAFTGANGLFIVGTRLGFDASNTDTFLQRDAANTLALRNGTAAQQFNIYNTYTDASNYERGSLSWGSNIFTISAGFAGSGVARQLKLNGGTYVILNSVDISKGIYLRTNDSSGVYYANSILSPEADDSVTLGVAATKYSTSYVSRSIQGSKSKALTESSATSFVRIAVPQTAGANYGGGSAVYTIYSTDGTDSQSLNGDIRWAMVNKAGTESCSIGEVGTPVLAESTGASTLTCTFTCATAAADTVDISANCVSSLVQTTFTAQYRLNMPQPNTVTPQ